MTIPKYLEEMLQQEGRSDADLASVSISYSVDDSLSPRIATNVKYDSWKAITYAKNYCGKEDNSCGVFLNEPGKTDCAHFVAHCLAAGGITVKTTDPSANFCPSGLAVRNTDLVAALQRLATQHNNVTEMGMVDAIVGDIGFLSNLRRPSHAFILCEPVDLRDPLKPAKIWAHTANKCCEDTGAEIRQWFATMFRIMDS
jgi:hypothetical protein